MNAAGQPPGTRDIACPTVGAGGTVTCTGTVNEPGVFPQLGGVVRVIVGRVPAMAKAAATVVVLPPLPLLLPPPLLAPPPPPLLLSPPPRGPQPGMQQAMPGVPVIPEADSLVLLGAGQAVLGGAVAWRRRT